MMSQKNEKDKTTERLIIYPIVITLVFFVILGGILNNLLKAAEHKLTVGLSSGCLGTLVAAAIALLVWYLLSRNIWKVSGVKNLGLGMLLGMPLLAFAAINFIS